MGVKKSGSAKLYRIVRPKVKYISLCAQDEGIWGSGGLVPLLEFSAIGSEWSATCQASFIPWGRVPITVKTVYP